MSLSQTRHERHNVALTRMQPCANCPAFAFSHFSTVLHLVYLKLSFNWPPALWSGRHRRRAGTKGSESLFSTGNYASKERL